jgi:hypothetical protein
MTAAERQRRHRAQLRDKPVTKKTPAPPAPAAPATGQLAADNHALKAALADAKATIARLKADADLKARESTIRIAELMEQAFHRPGGIWTPSEYKAVVRCLHEDTMGPLLRREPDEQHRRKLLAMFTAAVQLLTGAKAQLASKREPSREDEERQRQRHEDRARGQAAYEARRARGKAAWAKRQAREAAKAK